MTAPPGSKVVPAVLPALEEEKDVRKAYKGKGGDGEAIHSLLKPSVMKTRMRSGWGSDYTWGVCEGGRVAATPACSTSDGDCTYHGSCNSVNMSHQFLWRNLAFKLTTVWVVRDSCV